jgi:deoxyribose-phosphate aldolase
MNIAEYIDHTVLKPTTTLQDVEKLCEEALSYQFFLANDEPSNQDSV